MNDSLFENTKLASYFFWEYTQSDNALALWVCAEDAANYLETAGITTARQIDEIVSKGVYSLDYIIFTRNIAYRIYVYTGNERAEANWYAAERLISDAEWRGAIARIAAIYRDNINNFETLTGVRSEQVRQNYS